MTTLLTQEQWAEKLRSFVPVWFYETKEYNEAYLQGIAQALALIQADAYDHFAQTFILNATSIFLDAHGEERSVARLTNEVDPQYRPRVQYLANRSNCPAIKAVVDRLLIYGESEIVEDPDAVIFCNRDVYLNRNAILIEEIYNCFSILVEKQVHDPFSFMNREQFAGREDFMGLAESKQQVFELIVEAVNRLKAAGVFYRVIELLEISDA